MDPNLACTCGNDMWEPHTEIKVTVDAARGSLGRHVPPGAERFTVVRCTECRQPMADVLEQMGLIAT